MTASIVLTGSPQVTAAGTTDISASPTLRSVDPGVSAVFTMTVDNLGTTDDVVSLEVKGLPKNWTGTFDDESVEVEAGKTTTTTLTIKTAKDAPAGDTVLNITATSTMVGSKAYSEVKVRVLQVYKLDIQVAPVGAVGPGGIASIVINLRNDGNDEDVVSLTIVPNGAATTWARLEKKTFDLQAGQSTAYTHVLNVPKDAEPGTYEFFIMAKSSGPNADVTKSVAVTIQGGASPGLGIDAMTMTVIVVIIFFVIVVALVALYNPKKPQDSSNASKEEKGSRTVKKVKRKKRGTDDRGAKDIDDHKRHLERIEKRIEELHEKVEGMHQGHRELMGHFETHLSDHHGQKKEVMPPPPLPPPPLPPPGNSKEGKAGAHEGETPGPSPGPHPEALKPEGPPENMSLGDDRGEIARPSGSDMALHSRDGSEQKRCRKCNGMVEKDWIKCPACGAKI